MKISMIFFIEKEFSSGIIHGVLTQSFPQRKLRMNVDENQRNVFNQRGFSYAIIYEVLTHSLPQRLMGLKVDENQHNIFQSERVLLCNYSWSRDSFTSPEINGTESR